MDIHNSNVLVIDTSYYIFHRYYATLKWYTYYVQRNKITFVNSDDETEEREEVETNNSIDYENLHTNVEFVGFLKKHFLQDLEKLKKKWSVGSSKNIIFCKDCSRETIWRNMHHSNYKGTRVVGKTFNGNIFPVFYNIINSDYNILCTPKLEADDVAYLFVNYLRNHEAYHNNNQIVIITNDNDYLQMRHNGIKIFNLIGNGVNLETRSKGTPEYDLLLKIISGDTSDNINAIAPKIGPKTAAKIANMTETERNAWITAKGPACVAAYENNKRLVDFRNIPEELKATFYSTYTFNLVNDM